MASFTAGSITGGTSRPFLRPVEAMQAFAADPSFRTPRTLDMFVPGLMRSPLVPPFMKSAASDLYLEPSVVTIPGGLTIVHNPAAGNNGDGHYANDIDRVLHSARAVGDVMIGGSVRMLETLPDRRERIDFLADYLHNLPETGWHYMLVVGGDATFADVVTAIVKSETGNRVIAVPLMGGTANDAGRMHGAKKPPNSILSFLRRAKPQRLDVGQVWINGVEQSAYLTQSFTFGASGELFHIMEQQRDKLKGPFKNLRYVPQLVREILKAKPFSIDMAGNELIVGDVVITGATGLGGISTIPLRSEGFMSYALPVDPTLPGILSLTGSIPLAEAVIRRMIGLAGFKEIALAGDFLTMKSERQVPIPTHEELEVTVTENSGTPKIRPTLNGDSIDVHVEHVMVQSLGRPVTTLALPDSELVVRQNPII